VTADIDTDAGQMYAGQLMSTPSLQSTHPPSSNKHKLLLPEPVTASALKLWAWLDKFEHS
jgi:hypothetical protein